MSWCDVTELGCTSGVAKLGFSDARIVADEEGEEEEDEDEEEEGFEDHKWGNLC